MEFRGFFSKYGIAAVVAVCCVFGIYGQQVTSGKSAFSCDGRTSGYYADISLGCQVYHMCDGLGRQFSYRCPSKTLFQQRMLICDHWYMVNCSKSEKDYSANLLIGQKNKAFVDTQFQRTPRPDLADPINIDFQPAEDIKSTLNLVGAEEDESADETKYFPPSHWSTKFSAQHPTASLEKKQKADKPVLSLQKQTFYKTSYNTGNRFLKVEANSINVADKGNKIASFNVPNTNSEQVNFPSRFKATTPVYPKQVDVDLSKFQDFVNPLEENENIEESGSSVNFASKFKATTPVYPSHVDVDPNRLSEFDIPVEGIKNEDIVVNFASKFKATTPVYPSHVDVDPSKLSEFDVSIQTIDQEQNVNESPIVNFPSKFKATTPVYPFQVEVDPSKLSEFDIPAENANEGHVSVNFESKFKATTPVYPKEVGVDLSKFQGDEEQPPLQSGKGSGDAVVNFASRFKATTPVYPQHVDVDLSKFSEPVELPKENSKVNFNSSFQATTPVYPQSVEATSPIPDEFGLLPPHPSSESNNDISGEHKVNFASNFQATTPDYPKSVEATSPDPHNVGLLAPQGDEKPVTDLLPPRTGSKSIGFDPDFNRRIDDLESTFLGNTFNNNELTRFMQTIKPEQLKDLKSMWHIPEYDFPLDSPIIPSYDTKDSTSYNAGQKIESNSS